MTTSIQHLAEHRVDAVEKNLGKAQTCKGHGQFEICLWIVGRGVEVNDERSCKDGGDREQQEHSADEREEAIGIGLAIIRVVLHPAHQLRDEHRVQCAAHNEDVDDGREGVSK